MRTLHLIIVLFCVACGSGSEPPQEYVEQGRGIIADHAMVVCAHPAAAKIGQQILKKKGNAVDAAVATQLALAVCYPNAGNLGGGGFMIVRLKDGSTDALDFREVAPSGATRDMFLDKDGEVREGVSLETGLAVGIPGTVDGIFKAHAKYGHLPFAELIQPAIDLARNGFEVTALQAEELNDLDSLFRVRNPGYHYFEKETPWQYGDILKQEHLARTLEHIRDLGRDGFYKGETAEAIVKASARTGGIITAEDLSAYNATWRKPVEDTYRKYRIISMPPPSSGGVILLQMLKMLENYEVASLGFQSPDAMHLIVEVEKRAYADRAQHLGDPDFWKVPLDNMLDKNYLKERMANYQPTATRISDSIHAGAFTEHEETTHLSVIDADGNAVSLTTTLNDNYGCKIFADEAGFLLNNEMDDFNAKPGVPNMYGLVGGEANAVAGGKRMLSSMTPTIVERDDKLWMVIGSPGGSTIITSVLQGFLNVAEFKMTMQEAVEAPRFHHQWLPDLLQVEEGRISSQVLHALEARGHRIKDRGPMGRVDAILIMDDGKLEGGADPRGDDTAEGF
ncbi:MAG: gamma-glutamyltransferase [Flavobacteriales bacterium]|nr:gamma-glutamyltransferase [Flavobacteriales bacterium]